MESVIERIKKGNFWQFHGGIHPPEQKFLTCTKPIASAQIPDQLIIPIRQHIGQAGDLIVSVGDKVLKGQALSESNSPMSLPVHAPTSGIISAIKLMAIPHPSGLSEMCLILTPDGEDTWKQRQICPDFQLLSKEKILEKIAHAGIAGMGGAGFPTQVKASTLAKIDYLIINAAECEPYITADDLLIQEHSPTILDGINILDHLLSPKTILIGIEDNKAKAISALKKATANIEHIQVCVIPTKYPSGGEKQLIQILTGQEVPSGVLPSTLGMVMQNVATCFAIADAVINDTPLIKRVVTVSGQALEKPQNVWALIGTPVGYLTQQCGYNNSQHKHLIMGGPMMGFSLPNDQIPVIKATNCILAPSEIEIASPFSSTSSKEVECIRCGQCADVCPAQLLPQELQWSAKAKDQPQLAKLNLFDCIECGACAYVCPSQIPLVHYYRVAKAEIRQQKLLDIKAEKAKVRFEARKLRLEREKIARAEKHKKAADARKARMNAGTTEAKSEKSAVAAALARVKAKKAQTITNQNPIENTAEHNTDNTVEHTADSVASIDNSKSPVANAIARAKAKKLAQKAQAQLSAIDTLQTNESPATVAPLQAAPVAGDKKSKVAAAIAKAKAKAKAKKSHADEISSNDDEQANGASVVTKPALETEKAHTEAKAIKDVHPAEQANSKKAKVAAAVAKAKAKAKQKKSQDDETSSNDDKQAYDTAKVTSLAEEKGKEHTETKATKVAQKSKPAKANNKTKAKLATANTTKNAKIATSDTEVTADKSALEQIEKVTKVAKVAKVAEDETQIALETVNKNDNANVDRKAKIAAAVAKAKAKKLANNSQQDSADSVGSIDTIEESTLVTQTSVTSDKKARIAAAIAKAKAKKLAASSDKSKLSE